MIRPDWAPPEIDLDRPNAARVYDYYLGGAHNFGPDRELAQQALRLEPDLRLTMRAQRTFLRRVVRYLVGTGITQLIDIGSGIPTVGNVHEVAQQANAAAKVCYVDIDLVAVAHSRAILAGDPRTAVVNADLRQPDRILADPDLRRLIDLRKPVAVLLLAVLHFIRDEEDPAGIVAWLRDAVVPGSYIAISHGTSQGRPAAGCLEDLYERSGVMIRLRTPGEIARMIAGLDLVEPGLVHTSLWRPDRANDGTEPARVGSLGAVGRKT
jgi:hypothetical protein